MKTIKISFRQTRIFRVNASNYLSTHADETKLKYALEKMLKLTEGIEAKWQSFVSDTEIDNAAVDAAGIIQFKITEKGGREYQYTKDGLKARDKAVNEKFEQADTNEIEPYTVSELPEGIEKEWLEVFAPFIEVAEKLKAVV